MSDAEDIVTAAEQTVNDMWWMGAVEATLALFFGIVALFWPGMTLAVLVYLFSAFVIGVGILEVIGGFMSRRIRTSWWATVVLGVVGVGIGVYLVRHPRVSFGVLILLIGLALITRGLLDIVRVFVDRAHTSDKVIWSIVGLLGIVAGIIVFYQPVAGGVAFVWVLGLYAIILGTLGIVTALALREGVAARTSLLEDIARNQEESRERAAQTPRARTRHRTA